MIFRLLSILWFVSIGLIHEAHAKVFYIDPIAGLMDNDGSEAMPWKTLQEVFEMDLIETQSYSPLPYSSSSSLIPKNADSPVQAGDTLMLLNGHHGSLFYRGFYNALPITIMNFPGHHPSIARMQLSATANVIIDGLTISPETAPSFHYTQLFYVESHGYHGPSHHVTIKNCNLFGISDATSWGLEEWNDVGSCIKMSGHNMKAINNTCTNIDEGIGIFGDTALVQDNQVINFAGDGMRGQGSYLVFDGNLVKNCYNVNGNHDDGFQAFTNPDSPFEGNILRGNIILNYEDPNQPFKGALQGIGCFDGIYRHWVIENNLIVVNHYHGISLYGADSCKIVNNTVIDIDLENEPNGTWIKITDHKNGTSSSHSTIQNNISFGFGYGSETSFISNYQITDYQDFQRKHFLDFSLKPGSYAVDNGTSTNAPKHDLNGLHRPQNDQFDIGAYELIECTDQTYILEEDVIDSKHIVVDMWIKTRDTVNFYPGASIQAQFGDHFELNPGFNAHKGSLLAVFPGACNHND